MFFLCCLLLQGCNIYLLWLANKYTVTRTKLAGVHFLWTRQLNVHLFYIQHLWQHFLCSHWWMSLNRSQYVPPLTRLIKRGRDTGCNATETIGYCTCAVKSGYQWSSYTAHVQYPTISMASEPLSQPCLISLNFGVAETSRHLDMRHLLPEWYLVYYQTGFYISTSTQP